MPIQLTDCFREMVEGCAGAVGIPQPVIDEMVVKLGDNGEGGEVCLMIHFPQHLKLRQGASGKIHLIIIKWDASLPMERGLVKCIYLDMRRQFIETMFQHWRCPVPASLSPEGHIYTDLTDYELELISMASTSYTGLIFHD